MTRPGTHELENPYQTHPEKSLFASQSVKLYKVESKEAIKLNELEKKLDQYMFDNDVDKG